MGESVVERVGEFPFLFGGTFIEGINLPIHVLFFGDFPSFSEGLSLRGEYNNPSAAPPGHFPSFSEGLSLRVSAKNEGERYGKISLPFRRDFH